MAKTGPQKYPGASTAYWYQSKFGGDSMESNVVVWHTTEGTSLPSYGGGGSAPNFTAKPDFARKKLVWYQHFDFDTSARALVNKAGGVDTNTLNVVQVEIVGTCDPATHKRWGSTPHLYAPDLPGWAIRDLAAFAKWAHANHGVPLSSAVTFKAYPGSYGSNGVRMSAAAWNGFKGHCGHQHVPENDHGDPGRFPMTAILSAAKGEPAPKPAAIVPKSRETATTVRQQADRALGDWPFIPEVEKKHGLPAGLLLAVGSRETNLTNKTGDGGHGRGVWQRDDRWWPIPADYATNVLRQAEDAATLLAANHTVLKDWGYAVAAYNRGLTGVKEALAAGKNPDSLTPGGDYAADVLGRLAHLAAPTTPKEPAVSDTFKQVWDTDAVPAPPSASTHATNPTWKASSYLLETYERIADLREQMDRIEAKLDQLAKGA